MTIQQPQFTLTSDMRRRIDPDKLAGILGPLVGTSAGLDDETVMRTFARLTWNTVVEPGDADAGLLTELLGPEVCFVLADGQVDAVAGALSSLGSGAFDLAGTMARWAPRLDLDRVLGLCRSATQLGLRFLPPESVAWPHQVDDLGPHAPQGLWLRGDVDALARGRGSVAIVGSRASTPYGDRVAGDLAAEISARDIAVVSGGAYGIDAAAHRATLASTGNTIAVLAGGGDRLYPSGNRALLERICDEGVVITEAPVGQPPTRWRFLQRNRLISALAQAVVVVEAGARSGALNTANHAMHLGRPLGAVPGPVTSASSVGCHGLLRDQLARLVAHSNDLYELWQEGAAQHGLPTGLVTSGDAQLDLGDLSGSHADGLSAAAIRVRDALRPRRRQRVDEIAKECGMSAATVRAGLMELQLAGLAEDDESGWRKARALT
ncbi:DNA-processing protein DprA [Gulosibacter molinativorax]|uniref:DNA-protecting protein DprA n=1 Tax=Gulosibacter molinativorax TaxID=256821 RepID=A0ABT7C9X9_9MICO|nr:DNA-processing protein DprA [Gulosibacter molinativorax]MDJ1372008.1 DNA-protecting protein DprA [Gulosibacter molinativorax]QUY60749.1 Putative DNA-binding/uptake protein [Gulosibacter molinativorax]